MTSEVINRLQGLTLAGVSDELKGNVQTSAPTNQLLNVQPTLVRFPYGSTDNAIYTSVSGGGAADPLVPDPTTSFAMARITISDGSSSAQKVEYADIPSVLRFTMSDDDVYLVSIYAEEQLDNLKVELLVTDQATFAGSAFRKITLGNRTVPKGYSVLHIKNHEVKVDDTTFGTVGTHYNHEWVDGSAQDKTTEVRSIRVQVKIDPAATGAKNIHVGAIFRAPAGWAKSAIMWYADDVPKSWAELAGPVFESYGWPYTIAPVSNYAASPGPNHMSIAEIKAVRAKGNEVHAHSRVHENIPTLDTAGKTRALKAARDYWAAQGMDIPSKFMAWPLGQYDTESQTIAADLGIKVAFRTLGDEISSFSPGLNALNMNRLSPENLVNPWQVDSMLNGSILRGASVVMYGHNVDPGGEGINAHSGSTRMYLDHIKRWCELVAKHEAAGRCIVTTPSAYLKMCGIDVNTHNFIG